MKATEQYFPVVLLIIMLYEVSGTKLWETVDEILLCNGLNVNVDTYLVWLKGELYHKLDTASKFSEAFAMNSNFSVKIHMSCTTEEECHHKLGEASENEGFWDFRAS